MCIVLATTAHPSYALIIIDNRDEFILRPTSRPHWWSSQHQDILSARDLQRAEQGTWLGITKAGNFAVLTNYKETDAAQPIQGARSRGAMVTAWLTSPNDESTTQFVHRMLEGEGVKGVGGFSLLCGKLRKRRGTVNELEPLAIISNRAGTADDIPWIAERRGEVYGLSNTYYTDPETWPKVKMGKEKVREAVNDVVNNGLGEEELVDRLYAILDTDTLPHHNGENFEDFMWQLKKSIFVPSIGHETVPQKVTEAKDMINSEAPASVNGGAGEILKEVQRPEPTVSNVMSGIYGTQRQTILLVDWEGNVTFRERSLWDDQGCPIPRGKGEMKFKFKIDGWNGESKGNDVHPRAVL